MPTARLPAVLVRRALPLAQHNTFSTTSAMRSKDLNAPMNANDMPRSGGIASMMRLPIQDTAQGLDACFVGVALDSGTSNRSGTRLGPRHIRTESPILRPFNVTTGAAPFESLQVADIGDIPVNTYNLKAAVKQLHGAYADIVKDGCKPLTLGGEHTISYPILQALRDKYGPICLVTIGAHSDTNDIMMGEKIAHGTPFRRAIEEGCVDGARSIQIGLRGTGNTPFDYKWVQDQGARVVVAAECWHKSMVPLMQEVKATVGEHPVYISFCIDGVDPAFCPGTGTPEIGGLTIIQALEIVRGCRGMNVVGGDMVEVCPSYDTTGTTALTAANLLHEMLCVLPGVKYH